MDRGIHYKRRGRIFTSRSEGSPRAWYIYTPVSYFKELASPWCWQLNCDICRQWLHATPQAAFPWTILQVSSSFPFVLHIRYLYLTIFENYVEHILTWTKLDQVQGMKSGIKAGIAGFCNWLLGGKNCDAITLKWLEKNCPIRSPCRFGAWGQLRRQGSSK